MTLRTYLKQLTDSGDMLSMAVPISRTYEIAGVLKKLEPRPVLFEKVKESTFPVVGNLLCSKAAFASYFSLPVKEIIPTLIRAIEERQPCPVVKKAPCQEVVIDEPDLDALPILRHCALDGGNYISSGVFITRHPSYGQNLDFHRAMQFSKTELAIRVVKGRHFDRFLEEQGNLDVAVCIGVSPQVLVAAATSVELGIDELEIANTLSTCCLNEPLNLVYAKTVDLFIPAEAEFVLEGTVYGDRRQAEGPFVDLTGTYDIVRNEPVLVVKTITHRKDAIWHALLPGALEHKLLMGMPREPTIFKKVNQVVKCLDVNVSPGGSSWLHAIVQIDKQNKEDGRKAIEAAFAGHRSCKHVFVVDKDIDIYNPLEVEWAMATRFQGESSLVMRPKEPGSSLDPSSTRGDGGTHLTTKLGFDLTKPLATHGKDFDKALFPEVDIEKYIKE
ncbi:MAG TPA: UbiD family decarboxylase [Anaerolineales bacterium]